MPVQRASGVHGDTIDGAAVLIGPSGTHVIELNHVGSLIWQSIDGSRDAPALVDEVMAAIPPGQVERDRVEADVSSFLAELTRLSLIVQ